MSNLTRAITILLLAWGIVMVSLAQEEDDVRGLLVNSERALDGYTFFAPQVNDDAYVIDNEGRVINEWDFDVRTREIHLLDNGNVMVLRAPYEELDRSLISHFYPVEGALAEYTWDGEMLWEYVFRDPRRRQHHGIEILPNGNVLALVWDYHQLDEAIARGLHPDIVATSFEEEDSFLPDTILEISKESGEIVWEWQSWDHLVQDTDENLPNYGLPSAHPQRLNINYEQYTVKGAPLTWSVGPHDWLHSNSVNYNPALGQIAISVRSFDELWIIDHSLSTEEAAGPAGDLLYRWGNPFAYGAGDQHDDRQLFQQHDVQWIDEGLPGAGNILLFNNRHNVVTPDINAADEYSSVLELRLPLRDDGSYDWSAGAEIVWLYDEDFYSDIISGVQRLPNGNTLITVGTSGRLIEVTTEGDVVWEYINPSPERNWVFRARKYPADHPGFAGKDMTPGEVLGT